MIRNHLLLFFLCIFFISPAQEDPAVFLRNSTYLTGSDALPFWMWANRNGMVNQESRFLNLSEIGFKTGHISRDIRKLSWKTAAILCGGIENNSYTQVNEAFLSAETRGWNLRIGMAGEKVKFSGLSAANGNLARSNNSRPYPMIRLSTAGYLPMPFLTKHLAFKAEYDEGLLNDRRFVKHTHLHHKSLYLKVQPADSWDLRFGFEHFVMWGGESQDERYGKLPAGFDVYWRYVFGASGDDAFPETDQINVAGNQFGTYQAEVTRFFRNGKATFYLSHPYEDYSGLVWRNWPDNLAGIFLEFTNSTGWLTGLLYEFTNTRQQSIRDSLYSYDPAAGKWIRNENDNYYSHGVYRSGYTYHGKMIGSPLFFPVNLDKKGIPPTGGGAIESSRFTAHQMGFTGMFAHFFSWKLLTVYVKHYGTYANAFNPPLKQISGLLELQYIRTGFPVELGLTFAADKKNSGENPLGIGLTVTKRW